MMAKPKKDKEGYIYKICKGCGQEFATHPLTYKAKVKKDICMDCFILKGVR